MKIMPLFDRVLAKPVTEQVSSAGIYIPANQTERSQIMTVVSSGDGKTENNEQTIMFLKAGDKVLVSKYAGTEVILDGEKYYILKQCDILARITD